MTRNRCCPVRGLLLINEDFITRYPGLQLSFEHPSRTWPCSKHPTEPRCQMPSVAQRRNRSTSCGPKPWHSQVSRSCWSHAAPCPVPATKEVAMTHEKFQSCIEAGSTCAQECEQCSDACIGDADMGNCVRTCRAPVRRCSGHAPDSSAEARPCPRRSAASVPKHVSVASPSARRIRPNIASGAERRVVAVRKRAG